MSKEYLERRAYRKSPGRQYGYEYDPLQSHAEKSESEEWSSQSGSSSRSGALSAQRPDPRRTRQLLRQSIIASKVHSNDEENEEEEREQEADEVDLQPQLERSRVVGRHYSPPGTRYSASEHAGQKRLIEPRRLMRSVVEEPTVWQDLSETEFSPENDDFDEPDPLDLRMRERAGAGKLRPGQYLPPERSRQPRVERSRYYAQDEDEESEEEDIYRGEDRPVGRLTRKKKPLSRRGLLFGAGAAVVAGAGIAAYEVAPRIPQAVNSVGSDIGHQVQDSFNRGVQQGTDAARKEIITSLESLEGFTLDGAIAAARLTRVAYDVFVSPVINFGATVTGDVLSGMLSAFTTARHWLTNIGQDNATLAAIEKVLDSWVNQVKNMPKQLNAITQTDLDGAQAYLRALQRKIDDEKAKLNSATPGVTPTAVPPAATKSK